MWGVFVLFTILPFVFGGDVILLTKDNHNELFNHPISMVKYFAPWCGHCKALAPHYEDAAKELKGTLPLFEINCDEDRSLCDKAGIQGFPTLKVYANGVHTEDYQGDRTKEAIVEYMLEQARPPASSVDAKELKAALGTNDYTVVLQSSESSDIDEFQKVARLLRKYARFYYTKEKLVDSAAKTIVQLNRPKIFGSKLEERSVNYKGAIEEKGLEKWVRDNLIGLVGIKNDKYESLFEYPQLVIYTTVDFGRDPSNLRYYRNRLVQAAKNSKSDLQYLLADNKMYAMEIDRIGVQTAGKKAVAVIRDKNGQHYVMEDEKLTVDTLKKFISDYNDGKLEVFVKSEEIPKEQEGDVVKVVGKTFNKIVMDKSKDVLIEFFAPWCGHCKALKPKYEELAKKLSKESEVVIAAIDATANSFPPQFEVSGYPTLYWVPKDNKEEPEQYNGAREVGDLLKFVAKSATNELSGYTRDGTSKQEDL